MEYEHQTLVKGLHIGNLPKPHLFHSFKKYGAYTIFWSHFSLTYFYMKY